MPCSRSVCFSSLVRNRVVILSCFVGVILAYSGAAGSAVAGGWDVCVNGCRYDQVGPALEAAREGDTIRIGPGVYEGGLTITTSVTLVGSGKDATVIRGGGPVIAIGTFNAATEPSVSIRGVTLTGGVSRTSPESVAFFGQDGVIASGGGVLVPPGLDDGPGATVSITNSAITGNRVAPIVTFGEACPTGTCPFAGARGGGIASWGNLTLVNTSVSHNLVGTASGLSTVATVVQGGAIHHGTGDLTIRNSSFEGNEISASAPSGVFAAGGAITAEGHTVTMSHDVFRRNSATLNAGMPDSVETQAHSGAVHLTEQLSAATIRDTGFYDNSAKMTNTAGSAYANSGAVHLDLLVTLTLSGSTFSHNSVVSTTRPGSPGNAVGDSGAGEVSGTITGTRFTGNTVTVRSAAGDARGAAGAAIFSGTMTRSLIKDNRVRASSPHGRVAVAGAGLQAGDFALTLKTTQVTGNMGVAAGRTGTADGGGISDTPVPDGPPGGPLQLTGGSITHNTLSGGPGITLTGGGVFSTYPVELTKTLIAGNSPDQCAGFVC